MSIAAITWVSRLPLKPSSVKFVLMAFADCANETGICFPSIDHVSAFTSQDRKTVISGIAKLEQLGYLQDTSKRRGRTGQIKVYLLKNPEKGSVKDSHNRDSSIDPNSELLASNGADDAEKTGSAALNDAGVLKDSQERDSLIVPNSDPLPLSKGSVSPENSTVPPSNSTVFPLKGSRKRDTEPSGNHQEPSENHPPTPQGGSAPMEKRKSARRVIQEPSEFAEVRKLYPGRSGGQRWDDAAKFYLQRLAEGHTHELIIAGIRRYAEWCAATGKAGSEGVQQAATFLGKNRGFLEPWTIPVATPVQQLSPVDRVRMANGVKRDERVVAERNGSSRGNMGDSGRDVWQPLDAGIRRLGS